jgi:hypothetical protein
MEQEMPLDVNIELALQKISTSLDQMSHINWFKEALPIISSIFATFLGAYVGYKIARGQENRKFRKDCHLGYLKILNELCYQIHQIITDLDNIDKFGEFLLGSRYAKFKLLPCNDYCEIRLKILSLSSYLNQFASNCNYNIDKKLSYDEIVKRIDRLSDLNKFLEIASNFEKEAINYKYLIDKSLIDKYKTILLSFQEATSSNMNKFDIIIFEQNIIDYAAEVSKVIENI